MNRPSSPSPRPRSEGAARAAAPLYQPFAGQPAAVVETALEGILASGTFRRSQRHRVFLRHVVRAALGGRHDELKEVVIGLEVFGRALPDYDPRVDPIVRVEAGRVREKLARYYESEGSGDAFEIQIPVGGYLPQLRRRSTARASARSLGSFAVMPFTSLSPDPDDAIFCEALADQLIDALSRVPGVRVVGRQSASKARSQSIDAKVVGRLLGVSHIVEGSVQRAGTRYRCIAQLSRTRDRACVWSERFQCDVDANTDLFALQDRVAESVRDAIANAAGRPAGMPRHPGSSDDVEPGDRGAAGLREAASIVSGNAEARDLYERARYLIRVRKTDGLEKGIALLERSIALDPDFAQAHSQLGIARSAHYGILAYPTLPAFAEVERCARRALELDPLDGDARALIASIAFRVQFDWPRAESLFREAIAIAPNSATAHLSYAAALVFNGRYLEAMEHGRIGLDLDPLNLTMRINLAIITAYARDYRTSIEELDAVLEIDAEHSFAQFMLGTIHLWNGDDASAMRHFEAAARITPDHPIPQFNRIFVHGFRGDPDGPRMLATLLGRLEGTRYQLYNRAMAEAYLGDVAGLCTTLRRSAEARELLFTSAPADPSFDPYRDDPAFVALMNDYGLPRLPSSPFANAHA